MAKVEGLKEKLHYLLYDAFFVPPPTTSGPAPTFKTSMSDPRVIRFFVDVQNKTPLETNMQAAGTLPSQNSYEVRAMRVVISSLLPRKEDPKAEKVRLMIDEPEILGLLLYGSVTSLIVGEKIIDSAADVRLPVGRRTGLGARLGGDQRHRRPVGDLHVRRTGSDHRPAELPGRDAIPTRHSRGAGRCSRTASRLGHAGRLLDPGRSVTETVKEVIMQYLGADDGSQITGVGYAGEVHQGPDGRLYEWVEGVDAWGGQLGFWQGLPEVRVDDPAVNGLGALFEAPDGSLYQIRGPEEDAPEAPSADDDKGDDHAAPKMGPGRPGEIRVGPDGKKYRSILGVGPGGHRHGFWRRLRPHPRFQPAAAAAQPRAGAHPRPGAHPPGRHPAAPPSGRKKKPLLGRILKIAKGVSSLIPGVGTAVAAGLTVATPLLKKAGVAGDEGLGALYQAPDGSLYALHGFAEEDLHGLTNGWH